MNQDSKIEVRKSILYNSLNELLRKKMPAICRDIEKAISDRNYTDVMNNIVCLLETHIWGQDTQWRVEAEVECYPCHESGRPFAIGGFVFLEEVAGQKIIHFKTQMYNSFDESTIKKKDTIKINYDKVNDYEFIQPFIQETEEFLDQFYNIFMKGSDIFVREWRLAKSEQENL